MRRLAQAALALVTPWRGRQPTTITDHEPPRAAWLVADAPTAARRMALRFPHLLPSSDSMTDFAEWASRLSPDADAEELADLYDDVCRVAGWFHDDKNVIEEAQDNPTSCEIRPALEPHAAANRFAEWIVVNARQGSYVSEALTALYIEHCEAIGHEPVPQAVLRRHLAHIPGIKRGKQETVGMRKAGSGRERRLRSQEWRLFPTTLETAETALPFDLPYREPERMRRAA